MIKRIDIENFGSFRNFKWQDSLRDSGHNIVEFKKLNIIYGRNYSGKTTLSRIIRGLETGKLPEGYENPSFIVSTKSGTVNQSQIPDQNHVIRVYNKDFVDDHLSFLRGKDGNITPFAIIGKENKVIEKSISEKETALGAVEHKTGLLYSYYLETETLEQKKREKKIQEDSLEGKLFKKANQAPDGIKHNTLFKDANYDIRKIRVDIDSIRLRSIGLISENEKFQYELFLRDTPLPEIKERLSFSPKLFSLSEAASEICARKIHPTRPIRDLLNDALLQAWVKSGIPFHKDKRETCAFCEHPLPVDIWVKLDGHFNSASKDLETEIQAQINLIQTEYEGLDQIFTISKREFYSILQKDFEEWEKSFQAEVATYKTALDVLMNSLQARLTDIFTSQSIPEHAENSSAIIEKLTIGNELIEKNNEKSKTLEGEQNDIRSVLRLNEVAKFIQDINLEEAEQIIKNLDNEIKEIEIRCGELNSKIKTLEGEIQSLRMQLRDEKKGADKVNEYLNHYFGHGGLKLEMCEDRESSIYKFEVMRGASPAYNLSEGECSLVAFCYFLAKLGDENSIGRKIIIYIDDPVSSLDSNHIFFVFNLIESLIARPKEDNEGNLILDSNSQPIYFYEQLFISTHNLEFLGFLKRLSLPKNEYEHFLVVLKQNGSMLELMPKYLRDYITEYIYLFSEIYTCSDPGNIATQYQSFYNFGNNLRRFLEAFLFFKYPDVTVNSAQQKKRIQWFCKNDPVTHPLVQRLINEFSHSSGLLERNSQPIDSMEISKLAIFVLRKIKDGDEKQFSHFLVSIDKPDPFSPGQV